jgi:hypothetical protein
MLFWRKMFVMKIDNKILFQFCDICCDSTYTLAAPSRKGVSQWTFLPRSRDARS